MSRCATCPDELLLFMHHVPYTYKLHSGKTVIQHIYDSHYEGATLRPRLVKEWRDAAGPSSTANATTTYCSASPIRRDMPSYGATPSPSGS